MLESKKYILICGVNLEIKAWVHNSHEHLIDWDPPFRTSKLVKWTQPLLLLLEDSLRTISINPRSMWLTLAQKCSWFETSSSNSYGKFHRCWTWIDDLNMDWALNFQLSPTWWVIIKDEAEVKTTFALWNDEGQASEVEGSIHHMALNAHQDGL